MKTALWLLLLLLAPLPGQAKVEQIISSSEITVGPSFEHTCRSGVIYAILPQNEKDAEPVAFAEVQRFEKNTGCIAKVLSHSKSPLVRAGDATRLVDLLHGGQDIPGRYDLVREGHREYSSRYKPLVYGGFLFGQTAATLDEREFLIGLVPVMYGITHHFQVDTNWLRLFEKKFDLGGKLKLFHNEDMKLSAYLQGTHFQEVGKNSWMAMLMFDNGSNSRSLSHTRLKFNSKIPEKLAFEDDSKKKDVTLELSTVNEWMLKSWHRIMFGPKFVAGEEYDLGFIFSMIFVFDRFHGAINLNVNSVRNFDFKGYKQAVGADLFWRF